MGVPGVINVPLLVVVFEYAQKDIEQSRVIQKAHDRFDLLWAARREADWSGNCRMLVPLH